MNENASFYPADLFIFFLDSWGHVPTCILQVDIRHSANRFLQLWGRGCDPEDIYLWAKKEKKKDGQEACLL